MCRYPPRVLQWRPKQVVVFIWFLTREVDIALITLYGLSPVRYSPGYPLAISICSKPLHSTRIESSKRKNFTQALSCERSHCSAFDLSATRLHGANEIEEDTI